MRRAVAEEAELITARYLILVDRGEERRLVSVAVEPEMLVVFAPPGLWTSSSRLAGHARRPRRAGPQQGESRHGGPIHRVRRAGHHGRPYGRERGECRVRGGGLQPVPG